MRKQKLIHQSLGVAALSLLAAFSAGAQTPYFQAVTNLNPAGYWPMHEVAAPIAGDVETNLGSLGSLANGYYADWLSTSSLTTHGVGGALSASGDNDTAAAFNGAKNGGGQGYLLIPTTSPKMVLQPPFTIEAWAYPSNTTYADMISQYGRTNNSGGGSTAATAGIRLVWQGSFTFIVGGVNLSSVSHTAGSWYHVVVTYDGTNGAVWVNGVQEGAPKAMTGVYDPSLPLTVGNGFWTSSGPSRAYNGAIDEVAVYTNTLSDSDIQTHYYVGSGVNTSMAYKDTILANHPSVYLRMNGPAYSAPAVSTWPVMTNYGRVALNGAYSPGSLPGAVNGPSVAGVPLSSMGGLKVMPGNGMSSYATAGYDPVFNPTNTPFSYGAWFRGNPSDCRSYQTIMGHSDSSWRAAMKGTGQLQVHGAGAPDLISPAVYNDGNWHQFVVTTYPSNTTTLVPGTNMLYVDGQLVLSNLGNSLNIGTNADVILGNDPQFLNGSTIGRSFAGQMCEAAFWDRMLSPEEVRTLWNAASVPPSITTQPVAATLDQNDAFTNTVVVSGSDPLSYQWYQGSTARSGQTTASLVLNPVLPTDAGNYYVVASNPYGSVTSAVVALSVISRPVVDSYSPVTYTNLSILFAGSSPTFSILSASGASPISYQWYANGAPVPNATNTSLTFSNITVGSLSTYCVLTNVAGRATSYVWTASVVAGPTSPYGQSVMGLKPAAYWRLNESDNNQYNGNPGVVAHDYAGANNGVYTNVLLGQPGYNANTDPGTTCASVGGFSSSDGGALGISGPDFSAPTNTSKAFSVAVWVNAAGQTTDAGIVTRGYGGAEQFNLDTGGTSHAFRFFVRNSGGTAGYGTSTKVPDGAWHHLVGVCDQPNGVVNLYIDGQLASSGAFAAGGGIFTSTNPISIGTRRSNAITNYNYQLFGTINDVVIYNYALSAAQVASNYIIAGVPPAITQQPPATATVSEGGTLTASVTAFGTGPFTYQWQDSMFNTSLFANQTNATLNLANIPASMNNDTISVSVANAYGNVNSTPITLTVVSGSPVLTASNLPPTLLVPAGKSYTYSVTASGTLPIGYQWSKAGSPLPGQTSSTLTVTAGSVGTSSTYSVVVTNLYGSVSGSSVLTAIAPVSDNYGTNVLALQPAGYWPLQETYAPAAVTMETNLGTLGALGNAYYAVPGADGSGTAQGTMLFGQSGALNNVNDYDSSVSFTEPSGVNYAYVPRISPALTLAPPLSMECWVNSSSGNFSDMMGYGGASGDGSGNWGGIRMSWNRANNIQVYYYTGSAANYLAIAGNASSTPAGTWHHIVATYDGTNLVLYTDGALQTSAVANIAPNRWAPFTIGDSRWDSRPTRAFTGLLDEVAVYTNALTLAQVQAHYAAGTTSGNYKQTILNDRPQLYYRMDCPAFTTPNPATFPTAVNYGSASANGSYSPGVVPGGVSGPSIAGLSTSLAAPINGMISAIHAGADPAFNRTGTQPFTAMTWFRTYPSDNAAETIMGHGTNWSLNLDGSTGRVVWNLYTAGQVTSTTMLNDGQWHMVAGVCDGTTSYLYVDGVTNSSAPVTASLTSTPDAELYLGGNAAMTDPATNERFFAGALAQAAYYTNALTAQQIQSLYNTATVVAPPVISISRVNGNMVITYTGTLRSSATVNGTYSPVPGASSPYTVPQGSSQMFYRTSNP